MTSVKLALYHSPASRGYVGVCPERPQDHQVPSPVELQELLRALPKSVILLASLVNFLPAVYRSDGPREKLRLPEEGMFTLCLGLR